MLPVVDERSSLLFFPGNFEGIENSSRVVYAGGAANQSVLPAVRFDKQRPVAVYPVSGRGIDLASALTDSLTFDHVNGHTEVTLTRQYA